MSNNNDAVANMPPLPAGFVPGDKDVVIGKGKKFYFHSGNQWLRTLVASMLGDYKQAVTKSDKSNIISEVVEYVRSNGRFVKKDIKTGQWAYAEPLLCREKCSQTFRDNLAETYRSSNVAKRNKRRQEQQDKKRGPSAGQQGLPGLPPLAGLAGLEEMPPAAKRMRNLSMTGTTINANVNPSANSNGSASAGIPPNLFDLDTPLWSPKRQATTTNNKVLSSLPSNFDFSSLVNNARRGSLTGGASTFQQQQPVMQQQQQPMMQNSNSFGGLNMQSFATGGDAMASLNVGNGSHNSNATSSDNWSNLLSSLAQTLNGSSNNTSGTTNMMAAPAAASVSEPTFNPFEPTPLQQSTGLPPLTGGINHNATSSFASMSHHNRNVSNNDLSSLTGSFDANAIFGALENVLQQQANQQQQQQQQTAMARAPKRHSLAPLMGDDWFKFSSSNNAAATNNNNNGNNPDTQNISTAFAA